MKKKYLALKTVSVLIALPMICAIAYTSGSAEESEEAEVEVASAGSPEKPGPWDGMHKGALKNAAYVGSETCGACHEKEAKEFKTSTHARISIPGDNVKMQGCEMCHGPASLHVEQSGGKDNIITPRKDPSACFQCHMDKKLEFKLPFHHPVMEGKMSCTSCHSPHGEDVRPWSATTLQDVNEACFKCHKDQQGPFVWEHEALREGCVTCHKPHGSMFEKMLVARDNNLCLRCHTQISFPVIGRSSHEGRLNQGTCFSAGCHTAPHGSNFDDHLRY